MAIAQYLVVGILIGLGLSWLATLYLRWRIGGKYTWLDVLSHTEWLTCRQMKDAMFELRGHTGWTMVYSDILLLIEEKLVEERVRGTLVYTYKNGTEIIRLQLDEHRLTSSGLRKRFEQRKGSPVGSKEARA